MTTILSRYVRLSLFTTFTEYLIHYRREAFKFRVPSLLTDQSWISFLLNHIVSQFVLMYVTVYAEISFLCIRWRIRCKAKYCVTVGYLENISQPAFRVVYDNLNRPLMHMASMTGKCNRQQPHSMAQSQLTSSFANLSCHLMTMDPKFVMNLLLKFEPLLQHCLCTHLDLAGNQINRKAWLRLVLSLLF
ncbi:hypothetical protein BDN70DRAFT_325651 [Pholiota conissans]|uniref:Uncharacterized protein n=1 Tax=Pholiota conissans TaxID=109636 RepID=A0A9P5YSD5_9AGAR|nr:hypothetical protein BDN70DRAFT_325651 [Pholiota conissans]